jgi:ankyrin repeat protein
LGARCTGSHTETPLHWAAGSDDVDALDPLLDAGGLDRHVGAGSDGVADVGSGQDGSVVDAVADHSDAQTPGLQLAHQDAAASTARPMTGTATGTALGSLGLALRQVRRFGLDDPQRKSVGPAVRLRTDLVLLTSDAHTWTARAAVTLTFVTGAGPGGRRQAYAS